MDAPQVFRKRLLPLLIATVALGGCATHGGFADSLQPVERVDGEGAQLPGDDLERGREHFQAGYYGLALEAFQSALVRNPESIRALNGTGAVFDRLGRYDLAQAYYYRALSIDASSVQTLNNLGYSLYLEGRYPEAVQTLTTAGRLDPDHVRARHNLERAQARVAAMDDGHEPPEPEPAEPPPPRDVPGSGAEPEEDSWMPDARNAPPEPIASAEPAGSPEDSGADGEAKRDPWLSAARSDSPQPVARETKVPAPAPAPAPENGLQVAEPEPVAPEYRVAVFNGNGRTGIAGRTADYLQGAGVAVTGIANAARFDHAQTRVEYRPGFRAAAAEVEARLGGGARLQEVNGADAAPVRVVLGRDFLIYDRHLRTLGADNGAPSPLAGVAGDAALAPAVEVSNGNGRRGMAARVGDALGADGHVIARLTNAASFDVARTTIYYRPAGRAGAERIAEALPVAARMEKSDAMGPDTGVRVVIGRDLLPHEDAFQQEGLDDA